MVPHRVAMLFIVIGAVKIKPIVSSFGDSGKNRTIIAGEIAETPQRAHRAVKKGRLADLKKQAGDAEAKLTRLYEAIESGLAALYDANLKDALPNRSSLGMQDGDRLEPIRAVSMKRTASLPYPSNLGLALCSSS